MEFLGTSFGASLPLALAALPFAIGALLYAYRRGGRSAERIVPSTLFLERLERPLPSPRFIRVPWRFLLELLIVALLVLAAAQFFMTEDAERVAVFIDNSPSTMASENGKTLFDDIKADASSALRSVGRGGEDVDVFEGNGRKLPGSTNADIRELAIRFEDDQLPGAVAEAAASGRYTRVVVLSDHEVRRSPGKEDFVESHSSQLSDHARDNFAILSSRVAPSGNLELEVARFASGNAPETARASVTAAPLSPRGESGNPTSREIDLRRWERTFLSIPTAGDYAAYSIQVERHNGEDALEFDNRRWFVKDQVGSRALFVSPEKASNLGLTTLGSLQFVSLSPEEYESKTNASPQWVHAEGFEFAVFHRSVPTGTPPIPAILLVPPDSPYAAVQPLSATNISRWDAAHPILRYVQLHLLANIRSYRVPPPPWARELISGDKGTIAWSGEDQGKRIAAFGFDLLPFRGPSDPLTSVLFLNAVRWLGAGSLGLQDVSPGTRISLSKAVTDVRYVDSGSPLAIEAGEIPSVIPSRPGLLRVTEGENRIRFIAVNFTSEYESDVSAPREIAIPHIAAAPVVTKTRALDYYLVAAALGLLAADLLLFGRSRRSLTFTRVLLRGSVVALIAASLYGVQIPWGSESRTLAALVDISDSVDDRLGDALLAEARAKTGGSPTVLFPFAGKVVPAALPLESTRDWKTLQQAFGTANIGETNLADALQWMGTSEFKEVLLLTDGQQTKGSLDEALSTLARAGVRVFPVIPAEDAARPEEFRIAQINAPLIAPALRSVDVRVSITNTTGRPQSGSFELRQGDKLLASQHVTLSPHEETVLTSKSDPAQEGITRVQAVLVPDDNALTRSQAVTYVSGEAREKVLIVSGSKADARYLGQVLKDQAYTVTERIAEQGVPELASAQEYSAIILNNVALPELPSRAAENIQTFTRAGGGFLMIGGNKSFGLGGYRGTAIEEILPVRLVPPRAEEKRLNIAVMLVVDKSQSMEASSKLNYTKEAAWAVLENLKDEDLLGVIAFDTTPWEVLRLTRLSGQREFARERISRIWAKGSTNLFPALEEARRRLEGAQAGRKHIIVLTDGKVRDAGLHYVAGVKNMRLLGITVSTVLVGSEFDFGFLESLAKAGGGNYYQASNPRDLPKIFLEDVKVRSGERTMRENQEYIVRFGDDAVQTTRVRAFPPLHGFVETKPKEGGRIELLVSGVEGTHPLLASGRYGAGKVVAFTSDANGRWSRGWVNWGRFREFWGDLVNAVRPPDKLQKDTIKYDLRHSVEGGNLHLELALFTDIGSQPVSATVILADGQERSVSFKAVAKGRYEATVQDAMAGKLEFRGSAGEGAETRKLTPIAFNLSGELFGERKGLGVDIGTLRRIAAETHGEINPTSEALRQDTLSTTRYVNAAPLLLLAAVILLLVDILRREGAFTRSGARTIRPAA